jgi:membrane-associated phospholipid phosphatase
LIELVIAAVLSVVAGIAWGLVVNAFPHADPARLASQRLSAEVDERFELRRFMRARLDPETATGLALTLALVGVVLIFVVFGVAAAMIRSNSGVVTIDVEVTRWAAAHETAASLSVFGWLTWAGSTIGVIVVALATTLYAIRARRQWSVALFFLVVLGGQLLLSNLVKVAVGRIRPDAAPFHVFTGPSFPSGHATAAAATWAAVALVLGRGASPRARAVLGGTAAGIAVAVACSRVFLGAHWTSDVIGGLLLGWTWFGLCAVAFGGRVLRLGAPAKEAAISAQAPEESRSSAPDDERPPPQR